MFRNAALILLASLLLVGCSLGSSRDAWVSAIPAPEIVGSQTTPIGKYIKHVVIVIQENRSFENLFAGWPGADAPMTAMLNGKAMALHSVTFDGRDLAHGWKAGLIDWNHGKMDGFGNPALDPGVATGSLAYGFIQHNLIQPYREMARQYVLADHMFPTQFGGSFPAHLDLIAGTTNVRALRAVGSAPDHGPWGCDAPDGTTVSLVGPHRVLQPGAGPFPCFTQFATMADTLHAAHVSWKYYAPKIIGTGGAGNWSAFDAIKRVRYSPAWTRNVISPERTIIADARQGHLASVSWVVPDFVNSDHSGSQSDTGPSWVASIVNAVGRSKYWDSTAIVVVWDEWGGWYDNVPPPQLDFVGLGIRVPCIIISPYARPHYVSHTQYEFGSILKFVEQTFGLPPLGPTRLGYTDSRANSLVDSFDFTQKPRAFRPIPAPYSASYLLARPPSNVPPDSE